MTENSTFKPSKWRGKKKCPFKSSSTAILTLTSPNLNKIWTRRVHILEDYWLAILIRIKLSLIDGRYLMPLNS